MNKTVLLGEYITAQSLFQYLSGPLLGADQEYNVEERNHRKLHHSGRMQPKIFEAAEDVLELTRILSSAFLFGQIPCKRFCHIHDPERHLGDLVRYRYRIAASARVSIWQMSHDQH